MNAAVSGHPGQKPDLEWVDIDRIDVDRNYQRELKPRQVERILKGFRWAKFGAVMLAQKEDGRFMCFDGQHRLEAARLHPMISQVPASIVRFADGQQEAAAFLAVNIDRTAISTVEKYWAGIEAQDAAMIRVRDVLARAGCEVIQAVGVKPAAKKTLAVTAVDRAIRSYGETAVVEACKALVAAWPKDATALGAVLIQAVARLFRNNREVISTERVVKVLAASDRKQLAGQADMLRKIGGGDAGQCLAKALVEIYNKGLQRGQIQIGVRS